LFFLPKNGEFLEKKNYIVNSTKFGSFFGKLHQFFEMKILTQKNA
jgi:hypothetical protein